MRGRRQRRQGGGIALATVAAGLALAGAAAVAGVGQQTLAEGFEGPEPLWVKGAADAAYKETAHRIADDSPHRGQRSEFLQIQAETGSHVHYTFDVGRAPVSDDLNASLWIKANRPGVQLLARVVLPHEPNVSRLDEPSTTLIRGETYTKAGRWQRIDLNRTVKLLREQQQLMRYERKREVNTADAYIDRLVLNVYGGPGLTEVWIDDVEVAPVQDLAPFKTTARDRAPARDSAAPRDGTAPAPIMPRVARGPAVVELRRENLTVRGERFFFRAIRHTDTPLSVLREAGFNTVWFDPAARPEDVQEAARLRFLIVPSLPLCGSDRDEAARETLQRAVSRFVDEDQLLFWDVGAGGLASEQIPALTRTVSLVRALDPQRPLAADVWDGFQSYSRNVGLIGVHRWPLMTSLELAQYRDWLTQRRLLAQPGSFHWTWVQTHLPDWYTALVYDRPAGGPAFPEPIGPQPEQIRLLTYTALCAGCRGLGFWSDRFLADSHHGRDRLLTLALLNQELQILEPLLTTAESPVWLDTSRPEVKAAMMRTERGILVLPIWLGPGAQFVPGQSAANNLSIVVPVPQYMEPWEVTPADVRRVDRTERVLGGTRITLNEFGLTTALVFTNDNGPNGLLVYFQNQARKNRHLAAQWSHDLAEAEFTKTKQVYDQLVELGHPLADGDQLLARARKSIDQAVAFWDVNNFSDCYHESQRALRPLRILMRACWQDAVKDKDLQPAVASPYAVTFYTLPRHWRFMEQIRGSTPGANILPGGDFEAPPAQAAGSWLSQTATLDEVDMTAERVAEQPKEGQQCLRLRITAKRVHTPPQVLERTFLAIHTPSVRLDPGTLVRVSGWVRVPKPIAASADGALLYDSAGGEPLAVRVTSTEGWQPITLYRKVPASGTINVTLALTGLGDAFFDDIRIEPLRPGAAPPPAAAAPPRTVPATSPDGRTAQR